MISSLGFRSRWAVLVALAVAAWPQRARAAEAEEAAAPPRPPTRSNFHLGCLFGSTVGVAPTVDGRPVDEPAGMPSAGLTAGYDQRLVDWLSLGAEARFTVWDSEWSDHLSSRIATDLDLVPKLHVTPFLGRRSPDLYLAPALGFSKSTQAKWSSRAVQQSWAGGTGANLGVALGLAGSGTHFGGYVEVGWILRRASFDATFTPVSSPADVVRQHVDYVTNQVMFTGGVSFSL
jgi:hypothetical protein